jgi:dipeptidyl aminopeptidase/acylaminoacyl peptidase
MKKIFIILLAAVQVAQGQTIESIMSAPFPTELTASGNGKTLAWVFNDQGSRNIWIAASPEFKARKWTNYEGDNGVEINALRLSEDGSKLVFVRGNTTNGRGEPANPAMVFPAPDRTLWVMEIQSGMLRQIGKGYYPKISPDGKTLAYLYQGNIWTASLSDTSKKPSILVQVRGGLSHPRWSPDGNMIAFVTNRGDHSFIGLYDIAKKETRYVETGIDHDVFPAWSPDGKSIAYIRIPHIHNRLPFTPLRSSNPWSIRVHDLAGGRTREVWKADTGRGSVFTDDIPVADNLLWWGAGNRIIFPWEKDGWQHLYSVDAAGGKTTLLTPGDGEVENVTLSGDGKEIYYTANTGDIDRRHIWKVSPDGSRREQVTKSTSIEWSPVLTDGGLALLYSTATRPARPALWKDGKANDLAPESFPASYPATLVTPQAILVKATDGMKAPAQLFLPPGYAPGKKYPAAIFLHGGSRRQMLLGFHYSSYYANAYAMNQYLASRGFIVLSLNYRSGIGYGLEFREALDYGATGASEVRDLIGAGQYLKNRADVDGSKIALWGGSYGGYLTAHGLSQTPDLFACGVDIHGVHNWNDEIPTFAPWYDPAKHPDFARKAFESSPEYHVKNWKKPVLMIHGDDDRNVPFNETVRFAEILRKQGIPMEELVLPDEVHGFLLHRSWVKVYTATAAFIERTMGLR